MNRASPSDLRKAMESANVFLKAGVMFVAMPVLNEADLQQLREESLRRLDALADAAEEVES